MKIISLKNCLDLATLLECILLPLPQESSTDSHTLRAIPTPCCPFWSQHGPSKKDCFLPTSDTTLLQTEKQQQHMAGSGQGYKALRLWFLQDAVLLLRHQTAIYCFVCPLVFASEERSSVKLQLFSFHFSGQAFSAVFFFVLSINV